MVSVGTRWSANSGVTRLDGSRGKKQVWPPMFEFEVFRKKTYWIEENTREIVGTFDDPRSHTAPP